MSTNLTRQFPWYTTLPTIVPVYSQSAHYTEWETGLVNADRYCIVQNGNEWALLVENENGGWEECATSVEAFLAANHLALAEA